MTPEEINEFLGREVMGWRLRRSKNPRYDWWVDDAGYHQGLARNWHPSQTYFGLQDCFRLIEKLIADGFSGFNLKYIACVEGFTWAASIKSPANQQKGIKEFFGGAGKTGRKSAVAFQPNLNSNVPRH